MVSGSGNKIWFGEKLVYGFGKKWEKPISEPFPK
jgi:hypothetical protein